MSDDGKTCTNLVFTVATVDKYAPRKTGVYNISLKKKIPGNKTQKWSWNEDKTSLSPLMYPSKALFEGANNNLIVFTNRGLKQQAMEFDTTNRIW